MTRDRKEVEADWNGVAFTLVDTGGVDLAGEHELAEEIRRQALAGARGGRPRGARGRRARRPAAGRRRAGARAARRARAGDRGRQQGRRRPPAGRSPPSSTGSGWATPCRSRPRRASAPATCSTGWCRACPRAGSEASAVTRLAVIGRPNVGKSSLVNRLLGEERVIVAPRGRHHARRDRHAHRVRGPGGGARGHRGAAPPHARSRGRVDYYAQLRSERAAERAAVAIVVCDAARGVTTEDLRDRRAGDEEEVRHRGRAQQVGPHAHGPRGRQGARSGRKLRQRPQVMAVSAQTRPRAASASWPRRSRSPTARRSASPPPSSTASSSDLQALREPPAHARQAPAALLHGPVRDLAAALRDPGQRPRAR